MGRKAGPRAPVSTRGAKAPTSLSPALPLMPWGARQLSPPRSHQGCIHPHGTTEAPGLRAACLYAGVHRHALERIEQLKEDVNPQHPSVEEPSALLHPLSRPQQQLPLELNHEHKNAHRRSGFRSCNTNGSLRVSCCGRQRGRRRQRPEHEVGCREDR